jgi:hypothetical protein
LNKDRPLWHCDCPTVAGDSFFHPTPPAAHLKFGSHYH